MNNAYTGCDSSLSLTCFDFPTGYSIFVVVGDLPTCEAHQVLTLAPVQLPQSASSKHPSSTSSSSSSSSSSYSSVVSRNHKPPHRVESDEHYQMDLAIAMSASLAGERQNKVINVTHIHLTSHDDY